MLNYNSPTQVGSGSPSDIDAAASGQMQTFFWLKKALIEARKEQYFMPLASTVNMPKHFGKTIKVYEYVPLLDERNINDMGIDAAGATVVPGYVVNLNSLVKTYAVEQDATDAAASIEAVDPNTAVKTGSGTPWTVTASKMVLEVGTAAETATILADWAGSTRTQSGGGNLYGSSKDVGTIVAKLPVLSENGGRVNRVGYTRLSREGSISKFGFFTEFTAESLDFDSDDMLMDHLSRELMNGAVQLTEAVLQKDLLAAPGVIVYTGDAVSNGTISGDDDAETLVTYADLMRLDQLLTDNRTPKQTKIITGSRMVDTKTLPAARVMFVGSELVPLLKGMEDLHANPAFIAVQHYGDAGTILNGEIGTIDAFRIVQVPEMLHWAGVGADVTDNAGYRETGDKYDVYPMLVVGDDSFSTIGFQTDGKTVKFSVMTKMPGKETADRNDPYGETGFSSIKWYYGILIKRPERIGLIKTVAPI
jgi:N4-gp56 family major capsid protein